MLRLLLALLVAQPAVAALLEPYAGGGIGDGLPAAAAPVQPMGVAVDADGNVYLSDQATARVRRVDAVTGVISTVVGGTYGWCGYGGNGTDVCLAEPRGLTVDAADRVYLTEATGVVSRWDPTTGQVTHIAGHSLSDPVPCQEGDGPAADACLGEVDDVAVDDSTGEAFILGSAGRRVFRVDAGTGAASTYAGCDLQTDDQSGEGGPAVGACLGHSEGVAVDAHGNVLIASLFNEGRIWRVDATTHQITRIAGGGEAPACFADDLPATEACFVPRDVTVGPDGDLFTVGFQGSGIRRIAGDTISRVTPGPGEWQIDTDAAGRLYTAAVTSVVRVDPATGTVTVIAGNGTASYCGENVPATQACLAYVAEIATDAQGNLFIADPSDSNRIRRVDAATGEIATIATGGVCRGTPDVDPDQVCFDDLVHLGASPGGMVFVADTHGSDDDGYRQLVRRLDPATGALTTVAGHCTSADTDGIPALDACVSVADLAADAAGDVYLAEGARVRRIDAQTQQITTVAGNGDFGCTPDHDPSGPALSACVRVHRLTVGLDGALYFVSRAANGYDVVLRLDQGKLATVAGESAATCSRVPDGAGATSGCLEIQSLVVDTAGNLFVGSRGVVRLIEAGGGLVTTLAGRSPDPGGADPCCEACSNPPECVRATDLGFGPSGSVLMAEPEKRMVRELTLTCGNGVLDAGEGCDDGNLVSGDGCDADCQPSRCGHPLASAACTGQLVPASVDHAFQRSCLVADRLLHAHDPRALRRLTRSILRALAPAQRKVRRAAQRGYLTNACAAALLDGLLYP